MQHRWPDICKFCGAHTWCRRTPKGAPVCGACHVVRFFQRVLYPPLGFKLLPWAEQQLRAIYGPCDAETGNRLVEFAYVEICKKNGKSFLLGGLPLYHLTAEFEDDELNAIRPKAYGAAAAKDQAGIVYDAALQLLQANLYLKEVLKALPSTKRIVRRDMRGSYAVLSADGYLQDGVEPSLALIDELHRFTTHKALTLHEVLLGGTIARKESLVFEITTAGDVYDSPLCWKQHERARQQMEGVTAKAGSSFYGFIYGADAEKHKVDKNYWTTRGCRIEANPSHEDNGGFLKDAKILAMLEELGEPAYKRYNLGIWGEKAERWMPMDAWLKCGGPTRQLMDRECWAGLDLSKSTALTSLVLVFPDADGSLDVLPFFWLPQDRLKKIEKQVHQDLTSWTRTNGPNEFPLLETTPGGVLDYEFVQRKIEWAAANFKLQEICYDPYNSWNFMLGEKGLVNAGYKCIEVRQGPLHLSGPMKFLMDKVLAGEVRHGNHQVLNWNIDCCVTYSDRQGNIAPDRSRLEKENKRIDGVSALVTALYRVSRLRASKSAWQEAEVVI